MIHLSLGIMNFQNRFIVLSRTQIISRDAVSGVLKDAPACMDHIHFYIVDQICVTQGTCRVARVLVNYKFASPGDKVKCMKRFGGGGGRMVVPSDTSL